MAAIAAPERYTIVSADGHAGGDIQAYKPYLASRWHDEFDAWAAAYVNPYADLLEPWAYRNWDNDRRLSETESNGIVAEVLFPNTVPPFFDQGNLVALPRRPRTTNDGGPGYRRTTAGWRTSAPPRRVGGPGSSRSSPTTSTTPWPRSAGPPTPSGSPSAASCCRRSRPTRISRRCGRTTMSRCGACAPSSTCRSTSTAAARCPTTGSTRPPGR